MGLLVAHAEAELRRAGLYDKDSDYGGMIAEAVMKLIRPFAEEGHSGASAMLTLEVFNRVARYKTLGPLTNDPAEWGDVSNYCGPEGKGVWQSRRDPSCFSNDGGKTYYSLDEQPRVIHTAQEKK